MSALENLLAEVRIEAEVAVRTEYENEVTRLRTLAAELEKEVQHLEAIVDDMDARYNELVKEHDTMIYELRRVIMRETA